VKILPIDPYYEEVMEERRINSIGYNPNDEWKGMELCTKCSHLIDEHKCEKYPNMDSRMFGRRYHCKHFKQIDHQKMMKSLMEGLY